MNILRRAMSLVLMLLAMAAAFPASAQDYPTRPVRMIVGFAAGGPTDILARVMAQYLSGKLGQQVIVENRVGGGGNTATEAVVNSAPDGYNILVIATANAINSTYYKKLPFDFMRDMIPVAGLGRVSYVMAVSPSLPVKSVSEFIAYAKANPGTINFAHAAVGGSNHLAGELFKAQTGISIQHVPYRGNSAAYPDIVAGRVQLIFADLASAAQLVKSGQLRGLAVTSTKPIASLPGVPTVAETVPGYEAAAWYGFGVPKGTPAAIVEKLNREINAGLKDPQVLARFKDLETEPLVFTSAEFTAFMKSETERWGRAVKAAGVSAD